MMLIDSLYPEEARLILINQRLLRPKEYIEHLFGRNLIIRFDMLKGCKTSEGCFKLVNEQFSASEMGLERTKDDYVLESITRSCRIENIEVNTFVLDSRMAHFSAQSDCADLFQFKIFTDFRAFVLGQIQYLILMDKDLCLAYVEHLTEEDEDKSHDQLVAEKFKYLKLDDYMLL